MSKTSQEPQQQQQQHQTVASKIPTTHSSSTISELSSISNTNTNSNSNSCNKLQPQTNMNNLMLGSVERQSRHLPSPLKKRGQPLQPPRYGDQQQYHSRSLHSPSSYLGPARGGTNVTGLGGSGRDSKSTILSEEFDDILTITTTTDTANERPSTESDLVIVDYTDVDYAQLLKPPAPAAVKTSLINRFLRNVTQKKIMESSIRKNDFFADKLRNEQKLLGPHLYVRGVRPKNYELIDDLNAEIAMEIEMSGANSPRRELAVGMDTDLPGDLSHFELGIGEISIDIFNGKKLSIFRDPNEQLLKVSANDVLERETLNISILLNLAGIQIIHRL